MGFQDWQLATTKNKREEEKKKDREEKFLVNYSPTFTALEITN